MTGSLSMIMLDQTVVSVSLPTIQEDLGIGETGLQWIINSYILAIASLVALGGRIGDAIGRPRSFMIGVSIFVGGSLACGLTPDIPGVAAPWIIGFRAVQGVGAALMQPASAALVTNAFVLEARGRAMSVYAGISQAFLAVGPLLGGALTQYASWRWVFLLNIPVGALAITLTLIARPKDLVGIRPHMDSPGIVLLIAGLGAFVLGIQQAAHWGATSPLTWGCIVGGLCLLIVFAWRELHTDSPLVQLRMFTVRAFSVDCTLMFLVQFALVSATIFAAIYFQTVLGFEPFQSGLAMLPLILSSLFIARFAGIIFDRVGARPPVMVGSFLACLGMGWWAWSLTALDYMWQFPGMMCLGFGVGLIFIPINTDLLSRTPSKWRGQASGVAQTIRQAGGTISVAVIGSVLIAVKRAKVEGIADRFDGTDAQVARVRALLERVISGEQELLIGLDDAPAAVVAQVRDAAAAAMQIGFAISAFGLFLMAVIAAIFMVRGKQMHDPVSSRPVSR